MRINFASAQPTGELISSIPAGQEFVFEGSTKGNNGLSVRVRDSKVGKARFVNLESGKLLTASAGDRGRVVDATVSVN